MTPNPHMERIIAAENYAELLEELTPHQLSIAALRLEGIPYQLAAELLGVSRQTLYQRLTSAQGHLTNRFPHIRSRVSDS